MLYNVYLMPLDLLSCAASLLYSVRECCHTLQLQSTQWHNYVDRRRQDNAWRAPQPILPARHLYRLTYVSLK